MQLHDNGSIEMLQLTGAKDDYCCRFYQFAEENRVYQP